MHTVIVVLALLAAGVATLLGFGAFDDPVPDPHTLGWLSLAVALLIGSKLVRD